MLLHMRGVRCHSGVHTKGDLATDLNHEYRLAVERMGLSFEDIRRTLRWAVEGSFLSPDRRQQAAKELGL